MKFAVILSCLYFFWTVENVSTDIPKFPIVNTTYGPVIGSIAKSRNSRDYKSFRGIPYAKPPVGNLRFRAPEPPESWTQPVNATKDAPACIQKNYFFINPTVEGQEDCLYLNIYIPVVNKTENPKPLPVMVFIHWGGFFAGTGKSDYFGPEYIMDKNVILITFNYRLGVFGFLTTLDDFVPGNFGLKDQVMALKFVQENIKYFGGDKDRVTLFGQSAGGGSVSLHLISPQSNGLFQRAISQSGVALNLWAKPLNMVQSGVTAVLAKIVGCEEFIRNSTKLLSCLRNISATDLAESADKFKSFSIEPLTPYSIVVEKESAENPNPFITKEPLEYLLAGEFKKVPYIVGVVQNEGILRASQLLRQPEILESLNANFKNLVPQLLGLSLSSSLNTTSLFDNITKFYLNGKEFVDVNNSASIQGFIDMYSDRAFIYGTYQAVLLQSQKGHKPIWLYNFDYRGQFSYGDKFAATSDDIDFEWGVSHCDDLLYLFKSPALFPELKKPTDVRVMENLVQLWTNFAIYGDPDPENTFKWKALSFDGVDNIKNENIRYLNITGSEKSENVKYKIENGFYLNRMKFWTDQILAENFPGLS